MGCRRAGPADGLVRLIRLQDGSLAVGASSAGRGAWLCRDSPGCIDQAERRRAFERAWRSPVEPHQVDKIRGALLIRSHEMAGPASESSVL